jgi:hypothetical protein
VNKNRADKLHTAANINPNQENNFLTVRILPTTSGSTTAKASSSKTAKSTSTRASTTETSASKSTDRETSPARSSKGSIASVSAASTSFAGYEDDQENDKNNDDPRRNA